jgi:uncharacterized protein
VDASIFIALLGTGAIVGFLAGLLGIGGGMIMTPMMVFLLGLQNFPESAILKTAIATSLATTLFTSISSVRAHHQHGGVQWPIVKQLVPGIAVGAFLGAQLASKFSNNALALLFGAFLFYSGIQMLKNRKPAPSRQLPGLLGMFGAGNLIGGLSGMVGAGGGFISVPFMVWCNVKAQQAVATSAALGFPIALAGTVGYVIAGWNLPLPSGSLGYVYLPGFISIVVTSVLTAPLGARTAHAMSTEHLKKFFALTLLALAAYMFYRAH